jgi:hypothetical protein
VWQQIAAGKPAARARRLIISQTSLLSMRRVVSFRLELMERNNGRRLSPVEERALFQIRAAHRVAPGKVKLQGHRRAAISAAPVCSFPQESEHSYTEGTEPTAPESNRLLA